MSQAMIWKKRYEGLYLFMGQVIVGNVFYTCVRQGAGAYRAVSKLPGIRNDVDCYFATEDEAREKLEAITRQWFLAVGYPIQV